MKAFKRQLALPAALPLALVFVGPALAQDSGSAAMGGPQKGQEVGEKFEISPDKLPEPYATQSASNTPNIAERGKHEPSVPAGFKVTLFADGLANPRQLAVLPDGGVLVAQQQTGEITYLKDEDGDGKSDVEKVFATGLNEPYGIALKDNGDILVSDSRGIWATENAAGKLTPDSPEDGLPVKLEPLTKQGVFGDGGGHSTRSLAVDPQSGELYAGVGSSRNVTEDKPPRATVQSFDADGSNQQTFATGTRNPVGLGFNPTTKKLWVTVEERDGLGNKLVPDYFTELSKGDFLGWPYYYIGDHPQPDFKKPPAGVKPGKLPSVLFEAHSSATDFVFYTGTQFPEDYRGDAFVTLRGSWNSGEPTGYKVVVVPFQNGKPTGGYENFMTGFWVGGTRTATVWGRPATIAETPDGALLVGDDTGGTIWRVTYAGDTGSRRADSKSGAATPSN